jgi:aldehyde:ferredoxin oxidoreductase
MEGYMGDKSQNLDRDTQAQHLADGLQHLAKLLQNQEFRTAVYRMENAQERVAATENVAAYFERRGVSIPKPLKLTIAPHADSVVISICASIGPHKICLTGDSTGWHLFLE